MDWLINMNPAITTVVAVIIAVSAVLVAQIILKARKQPGDLMTNIWPKLRPIIFETTITLINITSMKSYEELEEFCVTLIIRKVTSSELFSPDELALITPELIRAIIANRLHELWDKQGTKSS